MDDFDKMMNGDDFDFEFDDIDDTKSRKPVDRVLKSTKEALKESVSLDNVYGAIDHTVNEVLPKEITEKVDLIKKIKKDVTEPLGDNILNLRREGASFLSGVSGRLPQDSSIKRIVDKVRNSLALEDRKSKQREQSASEYAEAETKSVFGEDIARDENSIAKRMEMFKTLSSTDLNTRLLTEAALKNEFDKNVTNKYYRKSLELQFKQVFLTDKIYNLTKASTELRDKQFEALVRNTGLPDFVKTRGSEYAEFLVKQRVGQSALNLIGGNKYSKQFIDTIKSKATAGIDKLTEGFGIGNTMLEAGDMMKEAGIDPLQMKIEMAISAAAKKYGTKFGNMAIDKAMASDKIRERLGQTQKYMSDPKEAAEQILEQLNDKELLSKEGLSIKDKILKSTLELLRDTLSREGLGSQKIHNELPTEATQFDNMTKRSITTVIPEFLSRIYNELVGIRTGKLPKKQLAYDHFENRWTDTSKLDRSFKSILKSSSLDIKESINRNDIFRILDKRKKLSPMQRDIVINRLISHVLSGKSKSPYFLEEQGFLNGFDNETASIIKESLDSTVGQKSPSTTILKSIEKFIKALEAVEQTTNRGIETITSHAKKLNTLGMGSIIQKNRLITDDNHSELSGRALQDVIKGFMEKDKSFVKGFKRGGYTGDEPEDEVVGTVHGDEHVINAPMLDKFVSVTKKFTSLLKKSDDVTKKNVVDEAMEGMKSAEDILNSVKSQLPSKESVTDFLNLNNSRLQRLGSVVGDNVPDAIKSSNGFTISLTKFTENAKRIKENIAALGFDNYFKAILRTYPLPSEEEALKFYNGIFNKVDPTGTLRKKFGNNNEWLKSMYSLHMDAISDDKNSEFDVVNSEDSFTQRYLKGILPAPIYEKIMKNKPLTDLGKSILARFGKAGKDTLSLMKDHLSTIKNNYSDMMFDENGVHTRNPLKLLGFAGKTAFQLSKNQVLGSSKIIREGVTGIAGDVTKLGRGIFKGTDAFYRAPIPKELKDKLRLGEIDPKDVVKYLSPKERKVWLSWYIEFKRKAEEDQLRAEENSWRQSSAYKSVKKYGNAALSRAMGNKLFRETRGILTGTVAFEKAPIPDIIKTKIRLGEIKPDEVVNYLSKKNRKRWLKFYQKHKEEAQKDQLESGVNGKGVVNGLTGVLKGFTSKASSIFDFDNNGIRDGSYIERLKEVNKKRSKSIENNERPKKDSNSGLLTGLMGVAGFIVSKLTGFLSTGFIKTLKTVITSPFTSVGKILKGGFKLVGTGLETIGKKLLTLIGLSKLSKGLDIPGLDLGDKTKMKGKIPTFSSFISSTKNLIKRIPGAKLLSSLGRKAKLAILSGFGAAYSVSKSILKKVGLVKDRIQTDKATSLVQDSLKKGSLSKLVGKYVFAVGKKIPLLSLVLGGGEALYHAVHGDWARAGVALASGAVATVPVVGTAAAIGLDSVGQTLITQRDNDFKDLKNTADTLQHKPEKDILDRTGDYLKDTYQQTTDYWSDFFKRHFHHEPSGNAEPNHYGRGEGKFDRYQKPGNLKVAPGELYDMEDGLSSISYAKHVKFNGLNPEYKRLLFGMANEYYAKTGRKLNVTSAYRSIAYQAMLYRKNKHKGSVATPGKSMHNFGLAVDISTKDAAKLIELGLVRKYGFTFPVGAETWHMEAAMCQHDVARCRKDPQYASEMVRKSPGLGGPGWGHEKGKRKYSRNRRFQLDEMKAASAVVNDKSEKKIKSIIEKGVKTTHRKTIAAIVKDRERHITKDHILNSKIIPSDVREARHNVEVEKKLGMLQKVGPTKHEIESAKKQQMLLEQSLDVQKEMLTVLRDIHNLQKTLTVSDRHLSQSEPKKIEAPIIKERDIQPPILTNKRNI